MEAECRGRRLLLGQAGAHEVEWACLSWSSICLCGDMEKGLFRLGQEQVGRPRGGTVLGTPGGAGGQVYSGGRRAAKVCS